MDLAWSWNAFSPIGYLSTLLLLLVVVLWAMCSLRKSKPILCQAALLVAVLAFLLAKVNSVMHVNRIQVDPAEQNALIEKQKEERRKALMESRGEEVAQIQFAEDSETDAIDPAGMDDTDLKYLQSLDNDTEPEWKKQKKSRTGAEDEDSEVDTGAIEEKAQAEPILMKESEMMMADIADRWNLRFSLWFIFLGMVVVAVDYLRRANRYHEAYYPLPIPSPFPNYFTPQPTVVERPNPPRRSLPEEIQWLLKRGDSVVYFTDNAESARQVADAVAADGKVNVLCPGQEGVSFTDDFAFETWWYGRAVIVVEDGGEAYSMWRRFLELLHQRTRTRASVRQNAHVVWNFESPVPDEELAFFEQMAERTGVSLFVSHPSQEQGKTSEKTPQSTMAQ